MRLALLASLAVLASCGQSSTPTKRLNLEGSGPKVVMVAGLADANSLKAQAEALGLEAQGDVIVKISGDTEALNQLEVDAGAAVALDQKLEIPREEKFKIEDGALYLAKKDFGILDLWASRPEADGRGVTVGVFDDGISPHQMGFKLTTTGERKFLKRGSPSTLTDVILDATTLEGVLDEELKGPDGSLDLNGDGKNTKLKVAFKNDLICLDMNANDALEDIECKGAFSKTGDYFLATDALSAFVAEYDSEKLTVKFSQPEKSGDSHGEGVATVMAGFNAGGKGMDGVAPGAKIVDWDLSEKTKIAAEGEYTMGNILMGLEWLAKNGAEVANISYSLFFASVESQDFMSKAIDELVKKYNIVLSFSAGNNGPGLGSLNRKVIYPDSVLVAGAFVSKELDESVWGVTGLPEEGRVVYYSSRGPGPLGDHGPTLISPLSSLTHSSPSEGYRAFNGTSSASPALAGAATVLISALKAEGIKIDAPTIVQALRLSGKRLVAEPFVAQGYGLPQVPKAIEIYKNLIAGKEFMNVTIRTNRGSQDGIGGRGVLLLTSQSSAVEGVRVTLTGVISKLAPLDTRMNLLTPIKLEYSKGIKGAESLWVSASNSRFDVDIDLAEVLAGTQGEGFGEIKIKNAQTGALLAIVPVTVLDDKNALQRRRARLSVGSQGSARLHLNIPEGLQAVRVKMKLLEGESYGLQLSTFNSHRIRTQQLGMTDEFWLVTDRAGHYQVAVSMNGGTGREAVVEVELEPMTLELKTKASSSAKPTLALKLLGTSALYGKIELTPKATIVQSVMSEVGGTVKPLELTMKVTERIELESELLALESADTGYLYGNCSTTVTDADGKVTLGAGTYTQSDEKEKSVTFRCLPFDHGISGSHGVGFVMNILKTHDAATSKDIAMSARSSQDVTLDKVSPGVYEVRLKHLLGSQVIKLGEVNLL